MVEAHKARDTGWQRAPDLRWRLRAAVRARPGLYFPLWRRKRANRLGLPVDRNSVAVIEGYPRSANSFAAWAFMEARGTRDGLAHHMHAVAQIEAGVRRGLPVLLLIREPLQAVASAALMDPQKGHPQRHLWDYLDFYSRTERHLGRVVVAEFRDVLGDFGAVMQRLNAHFGSDFPPYKASPENDARIRQLLQDNDRRYARAGEGLRGSLPNAAKEAAKAEIVAALQKHAADTVQQAQALYARFTKTV